ncbi:hypothetical protein IC229_33555 [Spirosoma sp. BT702]|uniref:Uncharacterized protein n=1 Tax=Spirosoma profusum TaxID=2771354 RepID=A0A927AW73_9BACT|nr:hypothetical protein [Spirosoma profusum]MBD2705526.1 hypothetical protein [Spirosoma profusum]MBD2705583.1 hypothetical protein [Spirosoma profusum]
MEPQSSFTFWVSGYGQSSRTICAVIDAESEEAVWKRVHRHFRRIEQRFIDEVAVDWKPNDRFPSENMRT